MVSTLLERVARRRQTAFVTDPHMPWPGGATPRSDWPDAAKPPFALSISLCGRKFAKLRRKSQSADPTSYNLQAIKSHLPTHHHHGPLHRCRHPRQHVFLQYRPRPGKLYPLATDSTSPPRLTKPWQALKASQALLAHIKKTAKDNAANATKKNILDVADDDKPLSVAETPIWLTVTTKRHIHDSKKLQPAKIVLPHPLNDDPESTICLIVPEPQRHYKNVVASDDFPEDLRRRITRVIDLKHLAAKYKQYEAQRKLSSEHDIFLGDDRVINRLPKLLGKSFYKSTAKRPVPVVFQARKPRENGKSVKRTKKTPEEISCRPAAEVAAEIRKAIGAALVHLSPSTNTAVKVGFAGMTPRALSENIVKAADDMANKYVPKKKNGIKSLFVKGPETVALPIWQDAELWLDGEADVVAPDSELAKAIEAKKEQANVGKKRKSLEAADEAQEAAPKAKKAKKEAAVPASNDDKLDKQIAERKSKLRSAKSKAKAAMDD